MRGCGITVAYLYFRNECVYLLEIHTMKNRSLTVLSAKHRFCSSLLTQTCYFRGCSDREAHELKSSAESDWDINEETRFSYSFTIYIINILFLEILIFKILITQKKGHSCFKNIFSFNMKILKWDYIALIKEKYNCLNNCLPEWSHFI